MSSAYVPINCEFHDVLEATAIRRQVVTIGFLDESGAPRSVDARIVDLHAKDGVETMHLDDGTVIRLDRIVTVGDVERARREFPKAT